MEFALKIKSRAKVHTKAKNFKCYFCRKCFKIKDQLTVHIHIHTTEDPYECSLCKSRFRQLGKLHQHFQVIHKKQTFDCPTCLRKFTTKTPYKNHLATHETPTKKCPHCPKIYCTEMSLKEHIGNFHSGNEFGCGHCANTFNNKKHLKSHEERVHLKILNFSCAFCPHRFYNRAALNLHMNRVHFHEKDFTKCPESGCDLVFDTYSRAWSHRIRAHPRESDKKIHQCKLCNKVEGSSAALSKHVQIIHEKVGKLNCNLCGMKFFWNCSLEDHIRIVHTGERAFRCDRAGCGKSYLRRSALARHIKEHLEKDLGKKYYCDQCPGIVFNLEKNLKEHRRSCHGVVNLYRCYFCNLVKKKNSALTSHIRRHTGERPFKCEKCRMDFKHSLSQHKKICEGSH